MTGSAWLRGRPVPGRMLGQLWADRSKSEEATRMSFGEVLVARTVKELVAGSGHAFEDAGEHELKGVPDSRACIGSWTDGQA